MDYLITTFVLNKGLDIPYATLLAELLIPFAIAILLLLLVNPYQLDRIRI